MSDPFELRSSFHGPFFHANIRTAVHAGLNDGLTALAEEGEGLVKDELTPGHGVLSGRFRAGVHGALVRDLHAEVAPGDLPYGGWLEGVSRRNRPRPGFPGYAMFRRATERLRQRDLRAFFVERIVRRLS